MTDEATCTICGSAVDTREIEDGGAPDGCELASGKWVCSRECYLQARIDALETDRDRMRDALERIYLWSKAYPTQVFPEPDFKRAAALLSAGGMSLDVVSASNMRHATKGVGKIARAALSKKDT